MENFVITGKAKTIFRLIKLMAQAEKLTALDEKIGKKAPRNPSLN